MQTGSPQTSPLRERLPLIGWTVALAVVLAVILIAWLSYRQVLLINRTTEVHPETLGIWDVAQMQRQLLSLQGAVNGVVAAGTVHDAEAMRLELELVLSRIDILTQGVTGEALAARVPVHFSPVHGELDPAQLSAWILEDGLEVRLNLQLHKYVWGADATGV